MSPCHETVRVTVTDTVDTAAVQHSFPGHAGRATVCTECVSECVGGSSGVKSGFNSTCLCLLELLRQLLARAVL